MTDNQFKVSYIYYTTIINKCIYFSVFLIWERQNLLFAMYLILKQPAICADIYINLNIK